MDDQPALTDPDEQQAADAAAADTEAAIREAHDDETKKTTVTVTVAGVEFEFEPKYLDDVRFRRLMQQRRDTVALDWLIGERTVGRVLDALANENADGIVTDDQYNSIFDAIGKAVGAGNS